VPTPEPETATVKPHRNWPLRLTYAAAALTVLLLVGSPLGVRWYVLWSAESHLAAAIAEADRLDPGWRWEELEAKRAEVPEAENSALLVRRAGKLFPKDWMESRQLPNGEMRFLDIEVSYIPLGVLLNEELRKELRDEMARAAAAQSETEPIMDMPRGRFAWSISAFRGSGEASDDLQAARRSARLLGYDALLRATGGDVDGALLRSITMLNVGRSLGDFPGPIPGLARLAVQGLAVGQLERTLSLGQAQGSTLLRLQTELQAERQRPALALILRAYRAEIFEWVRGEDAKKMADDLEETERMVKKFRGTAVDEEQEERRARWRHVLWPDKALVDGNLAKYLERANRVVELAKLPELQQFASFKKLEQETQLLEIVSGSKHRYSTLGRLMAGAEEKLAFATLRAHALLDCAALGLAAERFRSTHGRWPNALDELVPRFVAAIPDDPFSGNKLLYRKRPNGIVIYSVRTDGVDHGGLMDDEDDRGPSNKDLGFRLLDPQYRRMLPLPPKETMPVPWSSPPPLEENLP
jgi:hypothetical protein